MSEPRQITLAAAFLKLHAAEMVDADWPEAHLNLGLIETKRRRAGEAKAQYETALRLDPRFVPALVNLADLDRQRGRGADSADLARRAMALEPGDAAVRHSLGLALVRQKNYAGALAQLDKATQLAPDNARYAYVYAIALNSTGVKGQATKLLEDAHRRHPADRDILMALVCMAREEGDLGAALGYARDLSALSPDEAQLRSYVKELESRAAR